MKYIIHGCWRDVPRDYLANKINGTLYIHVAGGWRPAIWVDDNGEGLAGYKCYYPCQRWNPPYLFIQVRYVTFEGYGIWLLPKRKTLQSCAWSDREQLCYKEVERYNARIYKPKRFLIKYLGGNLRFNGYGDIAIEREDKTIACIDVIGCTWDKSRGRFFLQTAHKDVKGWVDAMRSEGIIPLFAFFIGKKLLSNTFSYVVLTDSILERWFMTKAGSFKVSNVDLTKKNTWGDNTIPKGVKGWYRIVPELMPVNVLFRRLQHELHL